MRHHVAAMTLGIGLVVGCLSGYLAASAISSGPNAQVPQLKPLAPFAGQWEGSMISQNDGKSAKVEGEAEWVLDGRFLLTKNNVDQQGSSWESWTLWTFDTSKNEYRRWLFASNGLILAQSGQWDEKNGEFLFQNEPLGDTAVSATAKAVNENELAWTYSFSKDGKQTGQITGTNRRK